MEIRQLTYFETIVEEGTISAAARKLHISQPPLSAQMHLLENELQVTLFTRGARQIRLTDAGKALHKYAREILELEGVAQEEMQNLRTGRKGSVRIGLISSYNVREFFDGVRAFQKIHPDVRFKVFEGTTYELQDMLDREKIELAIVRSPFLTSTLETVKIGESAFSAIGKAGFFQNIPEQSCLGDFQGRPLITYRRRETILRKELEKNGKDAEFICIADDARTALEWAQEGIGVALVPVMNSLEDLCGQKDLVIRNLSDPDLRTDILIVRRKNVEISQSAVDLFTIFKTISEEKYGGKESE